MTNELKINPQFQKYLRKLSAEELHDLHVALRIEGCRDPIIVWRGYILDGHHRYEFCTRNNIKYRLYDFSDELKTEEEAIEWLNKRQKHQQRMAEKRPITWQDSDPDRECPIAETEIRKCLTRVASALRRGNERYETVRNEIGPPPHPDAVPVLGYTTAGGVTYPARWRMPPNADAADNLKGAP